jgi:Activator of Hsp90 ATPase homolog 1-like protein
VDSDWSKGGRVVHSYPDGSVAADGEVLDIDTGRFVTMTFHPRWSPEIEAEGPVRMTWQIEPAGPDVSKLTVVTAGMRDGGVIQGGFAGGIVYIVSGLKTYLETGEPMGGGEPEAVAAAAG